MKKISLRWVAVLVGTVVIYLFINQATIFLRMDKSRFDKNVFSGTHLALERDQNKYFTTFAHAGVLELAQKNVGINKDQYYGAFGSDQRATMPLEVMFFNSNNIKGMQSPKNFSVFPMTDQFFLNGIQNFTSIKVIDVFPDRDAWMIGAEVSLAGVIRKVVGLGQGEIMVEGLLGNFELPSSVQIMLKTERFRADSKKGLTITAYSDTVFWQNGVWVYDDQALVFGLGVDALPGDYLVFQDGSERVVKLVRSNGVIVLEGGRLDPYLHGFGSQIYIKRIGRDRQDLKRVVNTLPISDVNFYKGLSKYQRVLIPDEVVSGLAVNDYLMFADGIVRRISRIGNGYVDIDLFVDPLEEFSKLINPDISMALGSIQKRIEDPRFSKRIVRSPDIQPINSKTFITGNRFLYIKKDQAILGVANPEKAQSYRMDPQGLVILDKLPTVWATYTGILNVLYDSVHPTGRDYLIHVLGPVERKKYVDDFITIKPGYVQTSVDNFDNSNFHSWSLNTSWSFYEKLIFNYIPLYSYDYMTLWKRGSDAWISEAFLLSASLGNSLPAILQSSLPASKCEFELFTVTVDYKVDNPWKFIPVFGKTDRFFLKKSGAVNALPVSLPPDGQTWSFPLLRKAGVAVEISLDAIHPIASFSKIVINKVSIKKLKVAPDNVKRMFFPIYFSDETICSTQGISF